MAHQDDSAYYRQRAAEESRRAREAANAAAAAVHHELACRYGELAGQSAPRGEGADEVPTMTPGLVGAGDMAFALSHRDRAAERSQPAY